MGTRTERWLWEQGVRHWDDVEGVHRLRGVGPMLRRRLLDSVMEGRDALAANDAGYFQRRLPSREGWRIYGEFREGARFLDIETDGLSWDSAITVIGVSDGRSEQAFVAGRDLGRFASALAGATLLVTFNGKAFDVPFIRRMFPGAPLPAAHIDLMHLLRGLGMRGGLKRIEQALGLSRGELEGIGGADAVALWRRHGAGDPRALELLIRYNLEDVANLKYLMEWAYNQCLAACGGPGIPFSLQPPAPRRLEASSRELLRELRDERRWDGQA